MAALTPPDRNDSLDQDVWQHILRGIQGRVEFRKNADEQLDHQFLPKFQFPQNPTVQAFRQPGGNQLLSVGEGTHVPSTTDLYGRFNMDLSGSGFEGLIIADLDKAAELQGGYLTPEQAQSVINERLGKIQEDTQLNAGYAAEDAQREAAAQAKSTAQMSTSAAVQGLQGPNPSGHANVESALDVIHGTLSQALTVVQSRDLKNAPQAMLRLYQSVIGQAYQLPKNDLQTLLQQLQQLHRVRNQNPNPKASELVKKSIDAVQQLMGLDDQNVPLPARQREMQLLGRKYNADSLDAVSPPLPIAGPGGVGRPGGPGGPFGPGGRPGGGPDFRPGPGGPPAGYGPGRDGNPGHFPPHPGDIPPPPPPPPPPRGRRRPLVPYEDDADDDDDDDDDEDEETPEQLTAMYRRALVASTVQNMIGTLDGTRDGDQSLMFAALPGMAHWCPRLEFDQATAKGHEILTTLATRVLEEHPDADQQQLTGFIEEAIRSHFHDHHRHNPQSDQVKNYYKNKMIARAPEIIKTAMTKNRGSEQQTSAAWSSYARKLTNIVGYRVYDANLDKALGDMQKVLGDYWDRNPWAEGDTPGSYLNKFVKSKQPAAAAAAAAAEETPARRHAVVIVQGTDGRPVVRKRHRGRITGHGFALQGGAAGDLSNPAVPPGQQQASNGPQQANPQVPQESAGADATEDDIQAEMAELLAEYEYFDEDVDDDVQGFHSMTSMLEPTPIPIYERAPLRPAPEEPLPRAPPVVTRAPPSGPKSMPGTPRPIGAGFCGKRTRVSEMAGCHDEASDEKHLRLRKACRAAAGEAQTPAHTRKLLKAMNFTAPLSGGSFWGLQGGAMPDLNKQAEYIELAALDLLASGTPFEKVVSALEPS